MQLSLSGFLFEDDYSIQSLPFADFVALAREAGYCGVELRNTQINPDTPEKVVSKCHSILRDNGMDVTCMAARGLPMDDQERNELFGGYLNLAETMGCELLKVSGDPCWLFEAVGRAAEGDITLVMNTHINSATETVAGTQEMLQKVNHSSFGLLYDCMHMAIAGEDYVGGIDALFPQIRGVLVQCVKRAGDGEAVAIRHAGKDYAKTMIDQNPIQDWKIVFERLKQLGYDGWITVIENGWPLEQRKEVAFTTARYIRELWDQL